MELRKGQNLLEHGDEIYSRPARTWFQNEKEKEQAKGTSVVTYETLLLTSLQLWARNSMNRAHLPRHPKRNSMPRKLIKYIMTLSPLLYQC